MLNRKLVREKTQLVRQALSCRGYKQSTVDGVLSLDGERRRIIGEIEHINRHRNKAISAARTKSGNSCPVEHRAEMRELRRHLGLLERELARIESELNLLLLELPNIPHPTVPQVKNAVEKTWGERTNFAFPPKSHWELGQVNGILDFERAGTVSGQRFCFYKAAGARLVRALTNFMLDLHGQAGYQEMLPPFLVKAASLTGAGQFPRFKGEVFSVANKDMFLLPTAEVPILNYFREQVLPEGDLPVKVAAYSPCFRDESVAPGRESRGLIRMRQFNKVELMVFCQAHSSYSYLDKIVDDAEKVLQFLGLPYRVVNLSAGELGFASAKTYDIEVWMPGQNCYREVSSCSNCEDFQARRANIRYRPLRGGKSRYVHILNGSGLAVDRTVAAILENYQCEDGSIEVPAVLQKYMAGDTIIK